MEAPRDPTSIVDDLDAAFGAFVTTHGRLVYTIALRLEGRAAEAEDLAQECFVRAYEALRGWPPERRAALTPQPWLASIVRNLWRNRRRDASRRPRTTPLDGELGVAAAEPGPLEHAVARTEDEQLVALLDHLTASQREAVVLHHIVGLPYSDVAVAMGRPEATARSHAARGVKRLRTLLDRLERLERTEGTT